MVGQDVFGMTEKESDDWYSSLVAAEKEIENIVNLDPVSRTLIWADGKSLSFNESVGRIHSRHSSQSRDQLHTHLRNWLEMGDLPDGLTEEELERLDSLVSAWAEEIPDGLTASADS